MTLYRRRIVVDVAGITITEPRITAQVERHADDTQSTGGVSIYNLSPSNSDRIYERGTDIRIQAGYPDTLGTIFEGQVQRVRRHRQALAHITHIKLGDTVHAPATLGGLTIRTYAGGVSVRRIVTDIVTQDMGRQGDVQTEDPSVIAGGQSVFRGLRIGPLDAIDPSWELINFSFTGPASEALTISLKRFGVKWYEDDGAVRFRREGMAQSDAPTITITPVTGLIGAPQPTDEGAEVVMFLHPQVKIGGILDLQSDTLTDRFRIVALVHDADNWASSPFTTWCDLRELAALIR